MNLLVLGFDNYNDIELSTTLSVLKVANIFEKITFFSTDAKAIKGQYGLTKFETTNQIDLESYHALFIPGGQGAKILLNDDKAQNIVKIFLAKDKYIFAICDAPNMLMHRSILPVECRYSSYPLCGRNYNVGINRSTKKVNVDNKIVTASCPGASFDFAIEIVKVLKGDEAKSAILNQMYPSE
ncbi:DJ-1/PfpI family protein [Mycoplasmopsis opalescens]|uniref:DJ-1/PfpI family protein n=1 Tax=Mycoplasmopsis opalescens TaxID=114886 RepID=UPI00068F5727|nr:DJ-1/PfpI family protein [Mycoplasmopsis opalescens]